MQFFRVCVVKERGWCVGGGTLTKRAVAPPFELPPPAPSTPLPWLLILSGVFRSSPLPPRRDMTCTWSGMLFGGKVSCEGGGRGEGLQTSTPQEQEQHRGRKRKDSRAKGALDDVGCVRREGLTDEEEVASLNPTVGRVLGESKFCSLLVPSDACRAFTR